MSFPTGWVLRSSFWTHEGYSGSPALEQNLITHVDCSPELIPHVLSNIPCLLGFGCHYSLCQLLTQLFLSLLDSEFDEAETHSSSQLASRLFLALKSCSTKCIKWLNLPDLKPSFPVALEVASGAISEFGTQVEGVLLSGHFPRDRNHTGATLNLNWLSYYLLL